MKCQPRRSGLKIPSVAYTNVQTHYVYSWAGKVLLHEQCVVEESGRVEKQGQNSSQSHFVKYLLFTFQYHNYEANIRTREKNSTFWADSRIMFVIYCENDDDWGCWNLICLFILMFWILPYFIHSLILLIFFSFVFIISTILSHVWCMHIYI